MSKLITLDNLETYNNELNKTILKKVISLPEDAVDGDIYQYVGDTTNEYINGHIYIKKIYEGEEILTYRCYLMTSGNYMYINQDELKIYSFSTPCTTVEEIQSSTPKTIYVLVSLTSDELIYTYRNTQYTLPRQRDKDVSKTTKVDRNYWSDLSGVQQINLIDSNYTPVVNSIIQYTGEDSDEFTNGNFYKYNKEIITYWKFVNEDDESDVIYYKAKDYSTKPDDPNAMEGQLYIKEGGEFKLYPTDPEFLSTTFLGTFGWIEIDDWEKNTDITYKIDKSNPEFEIEDSMYWKEIKFGINISKNKGNAITQYTDGIYYAPEASLKQTDIMNYISSYYNDEKVVIQYVGESVTLDLSGEDTNYGKATKGQIFKIASWRTFDCYVANGSNNIGSTVYLSDVSTNTLLFRVSGDRLSDTGWNYESLEDDTLTIGSWTWTKDTSKNVRYPVWEAVDLSSNTLKQVTSFPKLTLKELGTTYQYIGNTTDNYIKNHIYTSKCDEIYLCLQASSTNPSEIPRTIYALNVNADNSDTLRNKLYTKNAETGEYEALILPDTVTNIETSFEKGYIVSIFTVNDKDYKYSQAGYDISTTYWEDLYKSEIATDEDIVALFE